MLRQEVRVERGFVLITVLMVIALFTFGALTAMRAVRSNIRASQETKLVVPRTNTAEGGTVVVLAYMLSHPGVPSADIPASVSGDDGRLPGMQPDYNVQITQLSDDHAVEIPGFSGAWVGGEYSLYSASWDRLAPSSGKTVTTIVFVPERPQVSGNE